MSNASHPAAIDSNALAAALSRMAAEASVAANQAAARRFAMGPAQGPSLAEIQRDVFLDRLQAQTRAALRGSAN